jgi:hypothetical protein
MKLQEIIEMLGRFGFEETYVRRALAAGDSAHNAFEQVKTALQIRWGEMCQELSVEQCTELRPIYDRLMGITMKARRTSADERAEAKSRVDDIFATMKAEREKRKDQNLRQVFDLAAEYAERQRQADLRKKTRKAKRTKKQEPVKAEARIIDAEYEEKKDG